MDAGRAVQEIHLQPGIVGENEIGNWQGRIGDWNLEREPLSQRDRFLRRIAGKSIRVLHDRRRGGKILQRETVKIRT